MLERDALPLDASTDPSLAIAEIEKRQQQCSNQNNQGDDATQVCGNGNTVSGDSDDSDGNVSTSQGLSRSDKIAIGVGVGGGVVAIIGIVLTFFQLRNRKRRAHQPTSKPSLSEPSYQPSSSWHQPQSSYRPFGRSELHE